jgi:Fic/DOC family
MSKQSLFFCVSSLIFAAAAAAAAAGTDAPCPAPATPSTEVLGQTVQATAPGITTVLAQVEAEDKPCPDALEKMTSSALPAETPSLCALYDRYHAVLKLLRSKGVTAPTRIADVLAPRFINLPDWQASEAKGNYDPNPVYSPAPGTWTGWESGREIEDKTSETNFEQGKITPINWDWIYKIHVRSIAGGGRGVADIRNFPLNGQSVDRNTTLNIDKIHALKNLEYKSIARKDKPIVSWTATKCLDQIKDNDTINNRKYKATEEPLAFQSRTFVAAGETRQCGYIMYADPSEVSGQLQKMQDDLNATTDSWSTSTPKSDPLTAAARAQRWFVATHPFAGGGNGRTSRFLMENVLQSEGLPTPILKQMDDDLSTSEKDWAKEIGQGMLRTVQTLEACAADLKKPGCNVVPSEPPAN